MTTFAKRAVFTALALAGVFVSANSAFADGSLKDGPAPAPYTFSWTGFYFGGTIGDKWAHADVNIPAYGTPNHSQTGEGLSGGVHAGYNYQMHNVVAGIEADWGKAVLSTRALSGNGGSEIYDTTEDWRASIRGRLGLAFGSTLVYGTAGEVWNRYSTQYIPLAGGIQKTTGNGWIYGGGVEHAFNPGSHNGVIIGRLEYLYSDLGTDHFFHLGPSNVRYSTQELRSGISIKF